MTQGHRDTREPRWHRPCHGGDTRGDTRRGSVVVEGGVGDSLGTIWGHVCPPHLLKALHVLEVESDVEKAQVGVDELELAVTPGGWHLGHLRVPSVSPR